MGGAGLCWVVLGGAGWIVLGGSTLIDWYW